MPKPAKKKTEALAKAETIGHLKARTEYKTRIFKNKKQFQAWIVERLESAIDKIDPMKLAAITATGVFIKFGIEWGESILTQFYNKDSLVRTILRVVNPFMVFADILVPDIPEEAMQKAMDSPQAEILEWALSFVAAYIIVEHADALLEAGSNILFAAKGIIGAIAV